LSPAKEPHPGATLRRLKHLPKEHRLMNRRDVLLKALHNETTPRPAWLPFVGVHGAKLTGRTARDYRNLVAIADPGTRGKLLHTLGGRRCRVDCSAAQWTCEEVDGDPPPALVLIVRGPCASAVRQRIRTLQPENPSSPDKVL
jgi:hypothetical protein